MVEESRAKMTVSATVHLKILFWIRNPSPVSDGFVELVRVKVAFLKWTYSRRVLVRLSSVASKVKLSCRSRSSRT
jgi:hypothetical protein